MTGFEHDAVKIFMPAGAKEPAIVPYREYLPPDTTACIFWLKNRKPAEWREKSEVESTIKTIIVRPEEKRDVPRPELKPDFEE